MFMLQIIIIVIIFIIIYTILIIIYHRGERIERKVVYHCFTQDSWKSISAIFRFFVCCREGFRYVLISVLRKR